MLGDEYDYGYEDGVSDGDASALVAAVEHRAAVAEAERDRLRAGIEKRCDEIKDRHQQNAHNSCDKCHAWEQYGAWPCGYIVEERAFRSLLAESGTPEEPCAYCGAPTPVDRACVLTPECVAHLPEVMQAKRQLAESRENSE